MTTSEARVKDLFAEEITFITQAVSIFPSDMSNEKAQVSLQKFACVEYENLGKRDLSDKYLCRI
jgi:hypothetical protein